jgi:hypothetical protein
VIDSHRQLNLNKLVSIITGRMILTGMMIITQIAITMKITTKTRIINTNKTITKGKIIETIDIIREVKGSNVKICMDTKINIKPKINLNKAKKETILSLPNIVSKSRTTIIIIKKTTKNTAINIGIIIENALK